MNLDCNLNKAVNILLQRIDFLQKIKESKRLHNIIYLIVLLFIFSTIFFLNIKTHMTGDDYVYSFIHNTQNRINSLSDIFESQYSHYFSWGGRSVVHTIAQLLILTNNNLIIRLINSFVFVLLIICIQYHIKGRKENSICLTLIIFSLTWILQPVFGETILWITGSVNYLWGTLIILLFLLPYRLCRNREISNIKSIIYSLSMFVVGIIAGWTNENTAAAMIVMIIIGLWWNLYSKQKNQAWGYFGLMGSIIGYLFMIAAPGNFVRAEGTSISPFLVLFRLLTHTQSLVNYLGALNLGVAILFILLRTFSTDKGQKCIPLFATYLIGVIVSIYIMVFSPGFPARAWFGSITFNIIAFGILLYNLNYKLLFIWRIKFSIVVFCLITWGFSFYDAYKDITEIDRIWNDRLIQIEKLKKSGVTSITFKEYQAKTKFGLGDAPYAQKYISQYYGIEFMLD